MELPPSYLSDLQVYFSGHPEEHPPSVRGARLPGRAQGTASFVGRDAPGAPNHAPGSDRGGDPPPPPLSFSA